MTCDDKMKLSEYARRMGVSWRTANRWFHDGQIEGAYQMPSGTIIVPDEDKLTPSEDGATIVYARVSSSSRRSTDLEKQAERLVGFCIANGWVVDKILKEVGSGLNDHRPKLESLLLSDSKIKRIVVEHKDRLTRFGFNYLQILAKKQGFEIVVVNPAEDDEDDLMEDFVSVITSFCARIYGQRRGKRKTEILTQELKGDD